MVEKKKYYHSKLNEGERQGGKCEGVGGGKQKCGSVEVQKHYDIREKEE